MHRVVIDTNVLVSGIIQRSGYPHKVLKSWEKGELVLITSPAMVREADKVLNYSRIKKKYGLDNDARRRVVSNLLKYSVLIEDPPVLDVIREDPDDNKVLSTAVEGKADYIVTGDSHLLDLRSYKDIPVVTPKGFCRIMER